MKYSEFHRKIVKNGWFFDHASGSHYFYIKNGHLSEPVPFHGSKEISENLVKKISKSMGLKY
jgi:predicted RNA binding protein YcfA (HicA-like mRNA interferase family)